MQTKSRSLACFEVSGARRNMKSLGENLPGSLFQRSSSPYCDVKFKVLRR